MQQTRWIPQEYQDRTELFDKGIGSGSFFKTLEQELPAIFSRQTASKCIGGLLSPKTLSNLDALKQGPPKVHLGKKVGYERESFLVWLRARIQT